MVKKTILLSAILASFASISSVLADDSNVISLTSKDFKENVDGKDLMLVEFFAPWCGHCKALAPEYEKAATELKESIPLAKVDCTENQDLCQEHGVQGYPTLKVFRQGDATEYKGSRQADGIVSYMKKQALPAVSVLDNVDVLNTFKGSDRMVLIAYLDAEDAETRTTFDAAGNKLRDNYVFGVVTDKEVAKAQGVEQFPSLVLYRQFDEPTVELKGAEAVKENGDIEAFLKDHSLPLLDQISGENFSQYMETGLPLAYIFTDNEEDHAKLDAVVRPIAQKYKGKVSFAHLDAKLYGGHANNVGLKEGQWPALAIQNLETAAKFPYTGELTTEAFGEYVDKFVAGEVAPHLNSDDIPEKNDEPVKVVVGKQFNEIVLDKDNDVFLEVYAPWCGHCQNLAPTWEKLAQQVGTLNTNVVIAKLDGTSNDIPPEVGIKVEGFPTLKFIKAGTNEIVDYAGDRSHADLVKFIKEHASNKDIDLSVDTAVPETEVKEEKEAQPEEQQEENVVPADDEAAVDHDEL
ncbi:thioredoxin-like protein [Gongronella butleri]|nr:thioredoxin-like protein [Gongronella butleri]